MKEVDLYMQENKIQTDIVELKKKETESGQLYEKSKIALQEIDNQLEKLRRQSVLQDKKVEFLLKGKNSLELSQQRRKEKAKGLQIKLTQAKEKSKSSEKLSLPDDGIASPLYYFTRACFKALPSSVVGLLSAFVIIGGTVAAFPILNLATLIPAIVTVSFGTVIGCGVIPNFVNSKVSGKLGKQFDRVFGQRNNKTIVADLSRRYDYICEEINEENEMIDNLDDRIKNRKQVLDELKNGIENLKYTREIKVADRDDSLEQYKNYQKQCSDLSSNLDFIDRQLYPESKNSEDKVYTHRQ